MKIEDLAQKLSVWRKRRGIDENSNSEAQMRCYYEERLECMDAIGDMVVTLINARALGHRNDHVIDVLLEQCNHCAEALRVDIGECISMAWREIEHRVGLVRSTGKFTKWKDLTHEERLKVAESGQLIEAPSEIVEGCKLLCTPSEWSEIEAVEQAKFDC